MIANTPERLQKILSSSGITSRREAERFISDGRVTVNGIIAKLGQSAVLGVDVIAVDGAPIAPKSENIYIMLNKPRGYVTTMRDEKGRKTVSLLVNDIGTRLYPVGRLDINSEGLLLMTNDGDFANKVTHPSHSIKKTYEVVAQGDIYSAVSKLSAPMVIDSHTVRADDVKVAQNRFGVPILLITIHEGRNRQVRKMCAECGLRVSSLKRVSIGKLKLGNLKTGKWRHLTETEVASLIAVC